MSSTSNLYGQRRYLKISESDYVRPEVTYQDTIQNKDDMKKLLVGYIAVKDVNTIPLYSYVRYVTLDKDKKQVFRLGGTVQFIHQEYLKLSNGSLEWTVPRFHYKHNGPDIDHSNEEPIFTTVFWVKQSPYEMYKKNYKLYKSALDDIKVILTKYKKENKLLKEFIKSDPVLMEKLKTYIETYSDSTTDVSTIDNDSFDDDRKYDFDDIEDL